MEEIKDYSSLQQEPWNETSTSKRIKKVKNKANAKTCNDACYFICVGYCCCLIFFLTIVFILWVFNYAAIVQAVSLVPY